MSSTRGVMAALDVGVGAAAMLGFAGFNFFFFYEFERKEIKLANASSSLDGP
jgi:hypothetical protein